MVTGGSGYIGSVLVPLLRKSKYEVAAIDTEYFPEAFLDYSEVIYYQDIRMITENQLKGIDAVIHLAALSNDPMGDIDPYLTQEINYLNSVRLAYFARKAGVKRFIFSSSCSVYGSNEEMVSEVYKPNPLTVYALSKLRAESEIKELATKDFTPVYLRNATVYGLAPKFRVDLAINNLTALAYTTEQVLLKSDGMSCRPFIHVRDLANVFKLMLEVPTENIHNEIFNIGTNYDNYTIRGLADIISNAISYPVVISEDAQPDRRNYRVNFTKFARYFPRFKFKEHVHSAVTEMWNALELTNFSNDDISKYTRLNRLNELMQSGRINSKLYWVK